MPKSLKFIIIHIIVLEVHGYTFSFIYSYSLVRRSQVLMELSTPVNSWVQSLCGFQQAQEKDCLPLASSDTEECNYINLQYSDYINAIKKTVYIHMYRQEI